MTTKKKTSRGRAAKVTRGTKPVKRKRRTPAAPSVEAGPMFRSAEPLGRQPPREIDSVGREGDTQSETPDKGEYSG